MSLLLEENDGRMRVKVNGVDVFKPQTGEVVSDSADGIACWFVDTDYNEESFFVRHAYFLGANDPYGALKTTLKAEINPEAWATLHSDTSRPFEKECPVGFQTLDYVILIVYLIGIAALGILRGESKPLLVITSSAVTRFLGGSSASRSSPQKPAP
jgi:hypothetical protein